MMGWGGGTHIADVMIHSIEGNIPHQHTRVKIYKDLIVALENQDWDNLGECIGISDAFDEALREHDPGWFDDDEGVGHDEPADVTDTSRDCDCPQWADEYLDMR
jgi:hypothetical protein